MSLTDADIAVAAAQAGSDVIRARYGRPLNRHEKTPRDFATDADIASERAMRGVLQRACPSDEVVGEELGGAPNPESRRFWLVDPLCGTINFAAQTPLFSVNVALAQTHGIRVAASADPLAAELFWTNGEAAWRRKEGVNSRLRPSSDSCIVDVNLDGPYPNIGTFSSVGLLSSCAFTDQFHPRVSSTTLALAWVAAGRRAAYVTDGHLERSLHFSSGIALCEAAGCAVTDLCGLPIHSGAGGLIVAADYRTHDAIMGAVLGLARGR